MKEDLIAAGHASTQEKYAISATATATAVVSLEDAASPKQTIITIAAGIDDAHIAARKSGHGFGQQTKSPASGPAAGLSSGHEKSAKVFTIKPAASGPVSTALSVAGISGKDARSAVGLSVKAYDDTRSATGFCQGLGTTTTSGFCQGLGTTTTSGFCQGLGITSASGSWWLPLGSATGQEVLGSAKAVAA